MTELSVWDWHAQLQAWQELLFGAIFLAVGLVLEHLIDVWRANRNKAKRHAEKGKTPKLVVTRLRVVRANESNVSRIEQEGSDGQKQERRQVR